MRHFPVVAALLLAVVVPLHAQDLGLIPKPVSVTPGQGTFHLATGMQIAAAPGAEAEAKSLADRLKTFTGLQLPVAAGTGGGIALQLDPSLAASTGSEGYQLSIQPQRIGIRAATTAGLFYGGVSLVQLALRDANAIPCAEVTDYPRFQWRGMMMDTSRHFMSKAFIERFLDLMAMAKMNRFHWHLVDSEGWRLEIRKYPKLTEVSENFPASLPSEDPRGPGHHASYKHGQLHGGGYYTQEDAREIVAYAAARHITVMPEIEFPAHSVAALTAYPQFGATGKVPAPKADISGDLYNVDDKSIQFLKDVLTEVMDIFPGEYIHFGGDEAPKQQWKASPFVQQKIKALGLKNEDALQSWLFEQMAEFVAQKGRRAVGWEEITWGGIPKNAVVMPWKRFSLAMTAANSGNDVIIATTNYNYFDSTQTASPNEPCAYYKGTTLAKVYEQTFQYLTVRPDAVKHILGAQGQIWGELTPSSTDIEYQVFPRAAALAEAVWTPVGEKNFDDFSKRLPGFAKIWDRYTPPVAYHPLTPDVFVH